VDFIKTTILRLYWDIISLFVFGRDTKYVHAALCDKMQGFMMILQTVWCVELLGLGFKRDQLTFWTWNFTCNSNTSPTWCNNFSVYYPDVYLQLNMFRAFSRPSSWAQWLQYQPLVLPSYRGDRRAVFVVGSAGPTTNTARLSPVSQVLLSHEVSRWHTTMHHSLYDSSGRVIISSQRHLPDSTQHSR
jgi:hypothetical protein